MNGFGERYVVDDKGNRESVIIDVALYERILDEHEELDAIRAYDEAKLKLAGDEVIPLSDALREIEEERP